MVVVMGDGPVDIQIVVATCPADNGPALRTETVSLQSGELDGLGDCARSIVSYASSSIRRSTISYQQRQRRAQWKGIGSRCMWDAFRFSLFGLLLLISGCIIVLVGYYSEFSVMEMTVNFNQSVFLVDPESQKRQKYSYSYFGPVLIGIGVFVLIGVGVATMEMRDMTAKVFPLTRRTVPRRRHRKDNETSQSKSKLTAQVLGEMFQTPTQRIMKEMTSSRPERCKSFRTVATQTFRPGHSWPWSRLKKLPHQRLNRRHGPCHHSGDIWRSCQQLCTPSSQRTAILDPPTVIFKRRRRHGYRPRLWVYSLTDSLAVSCPELDTVS